MTTLKHACGRRGERVVPPEQETVAAASVVTALYTRWTYGTRRCWQSGWIFCNSFLYVVLSSFKTIHTYERERFSPSAIFTFVPCYPTLDENLQEKEDRKNIKRHTHHIWHEILYIGTCLFFFCSFIFSTFHSSFTHFHL
jgi:hypothetical protein